MGTRTLDVCLACLASYLVFRLVRRKTLPLPPGPPGWPLIGNLLDFPTNAPYKAFGAMSSQYGKYLRGSNSSHAPLILRQALSYLSMW